MEVLAGLFCFLIAIVLVTLVGHGLWVLCATFFSSPHPAVERPRRRRPSRACVGCKEMFSRDDSDDCPHCGLNPVGAIAEELKDIDAAQRVLHAMLKQQRVAAAAGEETLRALKARSEFLLGGPGPAPPKGLLVSITKPAVLLPWAQLDAMFANRTDKTLSTEEKKQALALARGLIDDELRHLSPNALIGIARLQAAVGMASRACQAYQVVFDRPTDLQHLAEIAIEALETASKLPSRDALNAMILRLSAYPAIIHSQPALAKWFPRSAAEPKPQPVATLPRIVEESPSLAQKTSKVGPSLPPPLPVELEKPPATTAPEPPVPTKPRRSFAEWIGVFMEERNILWGELIGGTLIVGCSIALVISFWQKLEQIPFSPFFIIAAITCSLFGAGLYTLHHWKLEATSRGLLLIAILLTPLNFLVLAGLTRESGVGLIAYAMAGTALLVLGGFLHRAARILVRDPLNLPIPSAEIMTVSMLVSSVAQMAAPIAMAGHVGAGMDYAISLIPVLAMVLAVGRILLPLARLETWTVARIAAVLIASGAMMFASGITVSSTLFGDRDLAEILRRFAPAIALFGVPLLSVGVLLNRRLAIGEGAPNAMWRVLGTALALAAQFVFFGAFFVAVPDPLHRWAVGMFNVVALAATAWLMRSSMLFVPVQLYLAALLVMGWTFDIDTMVRQPLAAVRLSGLLAVQAIVAETMLRCRRMRDAFCWSIGAAVSTVLAALLVLPFAGEHPGAAATTFTVLGTIWLAANLRHRFAEITYACAFAFAMASCIGLQAVYPDSALAHRAIWGLLLHSTLFLAGSMSLRFVRTTREISWLQNMFRVPMQVSALASSVAVAVVVGFEVTTFGLSWSWSGAACCWLAAIWLAIALIERWPILLAFVQALIALAWFLIAGGVLMERGFDYREPYCLSVFGLGIAGLSLAWEALRRTTREIPSIANLLTPIFVPIDRVLAGSVFAGYYLVLVLLALWGIGQELSETPNHWRVFLLEWHDRAFSWVAWASAAVLAGIFGVWAREGRVHSAAKAFAILLLSIPLLAAGMFFADQRAVASATRWGLTLAFTGGSAIVWWRHRWLAGDGERLPMVWLRGIGIAGAVVPMLVLSGYVVLSRLNHIPVPGPMSGIFHAMGGPMSLLVPLAIASIVLAGHGFRERLAYYLSAASLLNVGCAIGGFLLTLPRADLAEAWVAPASLLIASATAWVWTILWAGIAGKFECTEDRPLLESPLLLLNNISGLTFFLLALAPSVIQIVFAVDHTLDAWIALVGSPWGWTAFAVMAVSAGVYSWCRREPVSFHGIGSLALIGIGLIACSIERGWPGQGFVGLMLASAIFSCAWVAMHLWLDAQHLPRWLRLSADFSEATIYAAASGVLAAGMSLSTLWHGEQPIHAAIAAILIAATGLMLARQRREERYAIAATASMMLASTILAIHFGHDQQPFWLWILHVNLAVVGGVSLVRLALHRWLAGPEVELSSFRFLPVQIATSLGLQGLMLLAGLFVWAWAPGERSVLLQNLAQVTGCISFSLNAGAVLWYHIVVRGKSVEDLVSVCGLMAGVLAAGTCDHHFAAPWSAFHALTGTWLAVGFAVAGVAWFTSARQSVGLLSVERGPWWSELIWRGFPASGSRTWVSFIGFVVAAITLWVAWTQDGKLQWPAGYLAGVAVLFGMLAIWARASRYQFGFGLFVQLVGFVLAFALSTGPEWDQVERVNMIVLTQALVAAGSAIVWSLLERLMTRPGNAFADDFGIAFPQAAIFSGILTILALIGFASISQVNHERQLISVPLAWITLASLSATSCMELWRESGHRHGRAQLYACSLAALGIILYAMNLSPFDWFWFATLYGSGHVLAVCVSLYLIEEIPSVRTWVRLDPQSASRGQWLWHVQLCAMATLVLFSFWITLSFDTWTARLGGSAACTLLTAAMVLMTRVWSRIFPTGSFLSDRESVLQIVLVVGLLGILEASLSIFDMPPIWLHRIGAVLPVLAAGCLGSRYAMPIVTRDAGWRSAGRSLGAILGVVAVSAMAILVLQELVHFDGRPGIKVCPLHKGLAVLVGLTFAGIVAMTFHSALSKEPDSYGIEGNYRSAYVYLGEVLLLILAVHGRLNVPSLFHPVLGQYWFFVVMALALAMTTTSDLFVRRGLPVLAVPIRRSAFGLAFVPVFAFRLAPILIAPLQQMREAAPGLEPFVDYLTRFSQGYQWEAVCWLLLGIFLGWQAQRRSSGNFGIAAALAINFGVWVLLGHQDATTFLHRPQLWLIPLGLIVLVAEYVNRERIGFWPSMSLRYVGLVLIYLSSTIEMFKEGLSQPWFAVILVVIAVAGMMLGILFRVRAFLLSGFLALLVVVFAQIWHAAVDKQQTWIWWASGLILGVLILVLFALFEKKRNEVLHVIDNMKRWS